jgi:hypothetical protein
MAIANFYAGFNRNDIRKALEMEMQRLEERLFERLVFIGEQFVKNARNRGAYTDQTGNLRSSIGYVILKDGVQLFISGFPKVKNGTDGSATGKKVIAEVAADFPTGYVLIVVAGMDYAAAVEAKGKDVLTASSLTAEKALRKAIATIDKKQSRS